MENTQDQRLATADETTPADGIASPLDPLVLSRTPSSFFERKHYKRCTADTAGRGCRRAAADAVRDADEMRCPICDQKPMNCDCTPRERAMWREMQEPREATRTLTDDEREAVETAALEADAHQHEARAATLRGLLERLA